MTRTHIGGPGLDEAALGDFYDTHAPEAYGLALGIVGKSPAAEDVTCQAFLETWRLLAEGKEAADGRKLLLATVHRRAAALVRDGYPEPRRQSSQPGLLPSWLSLRRENAWGVLSLLSEIEREVVELAYFGRYSLDEVADRMGLTLTEVDEHLQSALAALRSSCADAGEERHANGRGDGGAPKLGAPPWKRATGG